MKEDHFHEQGRAKLQRCKLSVVLSHYYFIPNMSSCRYLEREEGGGTTSIRSRNVLQLLRFQEIHNLFLQAGRVRRNLIKIKCRYYFSLVHRTLFSKTHQLSRSLTCHCADKQKPETRARKFMFFQRNSILQVPLEIF